MSQPVKNAIYIEFDINKPPLPYSILNLSYENIITLFALAIFFLLFIPYLVIEKTV